MGEKRCLLAFSIYWLLLDLSKITFYAIELACDDMQWLSCQHLNSGSTQPGSIYASRRSSYQSKIEDALSLHTTIRIVIYVQDKVDAFKMASYLKSPSSLNLQPCQFIKSLKCIETTLFWLGIIFFI